MPKENGCKSSVIVVESGTIVYTGTNEDSDFQRLTQSLQLQIVGTSFDGNYWKVTAIQPIKGLEGTFFLPKKPTE